MKLKFRHPTERMLIFIVVAIIGLIAAILWAFGQKITDLSPGRQTQSTTQTLSSDNRQAIQNSLASLYNDGVVDAVAKRVYFPGLNIYVPLTDKSQTLVYNLPIEKSDPVEATFSARSSINAYLSSWSEVPCLVKSAGLSVNQPSATWKTADNAGSLKLDDGRQLYLYKKTMEACRNVWAYVSPDDIVALLKQAQSY